MGAKGVHDEHSSDISQTDCMRLPCHFGCTVYKVYFDILIDYKKKGLFWGPSTGPSDSSGGIPRFNLEPKKILQVSADSCHQMSIRQYCIHRAPDCNICITHQTPLLSCACPTKGQTFRGPFRLIQAARASSKMNTNTHSHIRHPNASKSISLQETTGCINRQSEPHKSPRCQLLFSLQETAKEAD